MPAPNRPDSDLYVGLMSGTSMDAVDAVLVRITDNTVDLLATHSHAMPAALRGQCLDLCHSGAGEIDRAGPVHRALGELFAEATRTLLEASGHRPCEIAAIGSHGQTIRHRPDPPGFSVQLGCPDSIASLTGIPVVSDFRNRDMVLGGQGAPLVPRFHQQLFARSGKRVAVVNIGGMANVTLLDGERIAAGFDTGPGNALLNHWAEHHTGEPLDRNGAWAREGEVDRALLCWMLEDPYFRTAPPKSTGREYFHADWLARGLEGNAPAPRHVQATLTELTARTIADALSEFAPDQLLVCGGGAHNGFLMQRLAELMAPVPVADTASAGMHPDWIEGAAFAWLAHARLHGIPGNAPAVTGAEREAILGALYSA